MQKSNFVSRIPKRTPKPYEIHVFNSDWISFLFFGGNLLSTLGLPPAKIQNSFISKIPEKPPNPHEIHVPNSDLFLIFRRKFAKYPGLPPSKNAKTFHKQHPRKKLPKPYGIHVPNLITIWGHTV